MPSNAPQPSPEGPLSENPLEHYILRVAQLRAENERLREQLRKLAFAVRHGANGQPYNRDEALRIADEALS